MIKFDGTALPIDEALEWIAAHVREQGGHVRAVSMHPESFRVLCRYLRRQIPAEVVRDVRGGVRLILTWPEALTEITMHTRHGVIDIRPAETLGERHATFYDLTGAIVAEASLSA